MTTTPPRRMKVGEVPKYLSEHYGLEVTRQTIYNWMNVGVDKDVLQFITVKGHSGAKFSQTRVTTTEWVDGFLIRRGLQRKPA